MISETNQTVPWSKSFISRPSITAVKLLLAWAGNKAVAGYCAEVLGNRLVKLLWLLNLFCFLITEGVKPVVTKIFLVVGVDSLTFIFLWIT